MSQNRKPKFFLPVNIEELPEDLLVYPNYFYNTLDTIKTVKELRDEIDICLENKLALEGVLKELHEIAAKSHHELCKGKVMLIELYYRQHKKEIYYREHPEELYLRTNF